MYVSSLYCVLCDIFHFTRDLLYASDCSSLRQDNMFVGSLMIATQAVCGGMLSRSIYVTK